MIPHRTVAKLPSRPTLSELRELREDDRGGVALGRVGADRVAQRGHDRRRPQAAAGHVADHEEEAAVVEADDVVPVAADVDALDPGDVADPELDALDVGQVLGQQAVLERVGHRALVGEQARVLGRDLLQLAGQVLGPLAPSHEPLGQRGGGDRDDDARDREEPREVGEEPAAEVRAGREHHGELRVAEGHRLRHLAALGQPVTTGARRDEMRTVPVRADVQRVVEVGERGVLGDAGLALSGEVGLAVRDVAGAGPGRRRDGVAEAALRSVEEVDAASSSASARRRRGTPAAARAAREQLGPHADDRERRGVGGPDPPQRHGGVRALEPR